MARKTRIEFKDALYHVITRGNQTQNVFKNSDDFSQYLTILSAYKERYGFILHSYVLMSNHVHILIETPKVPLSKIMQGINQSYTMYFNRKYGTVGHLFQGRYKAILCDRDRYQLSLVKYIHLNPVRAGIVEAPEEYRWSSHQYYLLPDDKTGIVDTESVLGMFSEDKGAANCLYIDFIGADVSIPREDVYHTVEQRILGDEHFVEKVLKESNVKVQATRREREYTLDEIAGAIEGVYGISLEEIRSISKSSKLSKGKKMMSLVAHEYGYKGKEIAEFIYKDPVVVTRHLKEIVASEKEIEGVVTALKRININK
ncbi:MAG: transposase [Syntrophales bacterium]|jgi:REP element-mobilizing transposase RayT|nr:transposase [Syntrophales bacterium]MCK9390854.1 transposase [Syntrophales bacterium]